MRQMTNRVDGAGRGPGWRAVLGLVAVMVVVMVGVISPGAVVAAQDFVTTEVTRNNVDDEIPFVAGDHMVWRAWDGHDHEIMFYDFATGEIRQLTDDLGQDDYPEAAGNHVVWLHQADPASREYYPAMDLWALDLETGEASRLGGPSGIGCYDLEGDLVVWMTYAADDSGASVATLLGKNLASGEVRALSSAPEVRAWTDGRYVLAQETAAGDSAVLRLYDWTTGSWTTLAQLAAPFAEYYNHTVRPSAGKIVWSAFDGHDLEIYLYDIAAGATRQLTDNDLADYEPEVGGNTVLWHVSPLPSDPAWLFPPVRDVMLCDLATGHVTTLASGFAFGRLQRDGRLAVWTDSPQLFNELHLHDVETGITSVQATAGLQGSWPQLDQGRVVWYREIEGALTDSREIVVTTAGTPPLTPSGPTPPFVTFCDVDQSTYPTEVADAGRWGLMRGYRLADGIEFRPTEHLLRSQAAVALMYTAGLDPAAASPAMFTDLDDAVTGLTRQAINASVQAELVRGLDSRTFAPWAELSRAQLVTLAVRAAAVMPMGELTAPGDFVGVLGNFDPDHADAMRVAEYHGLLRGIAGFGPGWDPWQAATREEAAVVLSRVVQLRDVGE